MTAPTHISPHFTLSELTTTDHRDFLEAQAHPDERILSNLVHLCHTLLEPAREILGPLHVNSGWRCPGLNAAIGGSKTSRHMDGLAADVVPIEMDLKTAYVMLTQSSLEIDQAIWEFGRWIHLGACSPDLEPRRQLLAIYEPGKYLSWDPLDDRFRVA